MLLKSLAHGIQNSAAAVDGKPWESVVWWRLGRRRLWPFAISSAARTSPSVFIFLSLSTHIQGGAKRTNVPWPPRSPDLSACDFFVWGYLKSKVYVRKPRTVDDLKVSIHEEIAIVPQEMLVNVMQNFEDRLRTCVRQEGRHLSDIIFRNWAVNVSNQNCIYYRLFWC